VIAPSLAWTRGDFFRVDAVRFRSLLRFLRVSSARADAADAEVADNTPRTAKHQDRTMMKLGLLLCAATAVAAIPDGSVSAEVRGSSTISNWSSARATRRRSTRHASESSRRTSRRRSPGTLARVPPSASPSTLTSRRTSSVLATPTTSPRKSRRWSHSMSPTWICPRPSFRRSTGTAT
jgi:hypothetical protein